MDNTPAQIAKAALRRLVLDKLEPTPDNYARLWVSIVKPQGATVTVDGGMPAHRHGLPTQPQAAPGDAPGQYRIEGVRFQMPGEWVVTFTIQADALTDQVTFPLTLP